MPGHIKKNEGPDPDPRSVKMFQSTSRSRTLLIFPLQPLAPGDGGDEEEEHGEAVRWEEVRLGAGQDHRRLPRGALRERHEGRRLGSNWQEGQRHHQR